MLGKQWLNRYASTDMRGSAVERSQNRQRKLDGIVAWYFDPVMELLPLMLQAALLLLGCALSRYLWGVNVTVASVVLGVTASGIILYIFIVVAGAASGSCPYQTPGSYALRYLRPVAQSTFRSAASATALTFRSAYEKSETVDVIKTNLQQYHPWWSFFREMVLKIPLMLAVDVYCLGRAMIQSLVTLGSAAVGLLVGFVHWMHNRLHGTPSTPEQGPDHQATALDLRCISWMIQTSLDKVVHLSTLKHLAMIAALTDFNPALVADCFSIFIGCINVGDRKVVIMQGVEQLATVSAACFLRTFHHLSVTGSTSSVLTDVSRRYRKVFPLNADFAGLPFYYTVAKIHASFYQSWNPRQVRWDNYKPSAQEHIQAARNMVEGAQAEYQKTQHRKVPRWILRFTLHSLSLDPFPPTPVVADCLSIVAIDLGCDASDTGLTEPDERCVHIL